MKNTFSPSVPAASLELPESRSLPVLPAGQVQALDPHRLTPLAEDAIQALLAEGESSNTVRSYQGALRYWAAWFALRYGQEIQLPVPVPVTLQFIVDHAQRTADQGLDHELPACIDQALVDSGIKGKLGALSLSTLSHRLSVLSKVHQLKALPNPCQAPQVKELLSKTRRAYAKRGAVKNKKPALTREPLRALLETCDDSLRGVRDRALLLLAWSSGGRRRSEVTRAAVENIVKVADRAYVFTLTHSKTNQFGADRPENDKPVVGLAADALEQWLQRSRIKSGPIFRRIRRGDKLGEPLAPSAVRDIVKDRCVLAGLDDKFSAHSLRSGFVTEAARQNIPLGSTMALTGHASVSTVMGYFRSASCLGDDAARLMDDDG
jgi:integrase